MADVQDASSASPEADFAAFEAATLETLNPSLPTKAESAPAKPVDQAASTDATSKPASEAGEPKRGAKARSAELDKENAELQEKLRLRKMLREELKLTEKGEPKAESSPAPAKATQKDFERYQAMPDAPKLDDYQDYGHWSIDMAAFAGRKEAQALLDSHSQKQKQEYEAGQFQQLTNQLYEKGRTAYPDFDEVGAAASEAGRHFPETVRQFVLTDERGHDVAYALAKAKDDDALYQRIANPVEFGRYVERLLGTAQAPSKKASVSSVTKAPEPPVTLGSRTHDVSDPEHAAVAAGDFSKFESVLMAQLRGANT